MDNYQVIVAKDVDAAATEAVRSDLVEVVCFHVFSSEVGYDYTLPGSL